MSLLLVKNPPASVSRLSHFWFFFFSHSWLNVCIPQSPQALLWICLLRTRMTLRSASSGASQRLWEYPAWTDTPLKFARMEVSRAPLLTRCWHLAWAQMGSHYEYTLIVYIENLFKLFYSQMWLKNCVLIASWSMFVLIAFEFSSKTLVNLLNCCFNVGQPYRSQLFLKCHWWSYIMSYLTSPYKERGISGAAVLLWRSCF